MGVDQIRRPYQQASLKVPTGPVQVSGKENDVTAPRKLGVVAAWAFERAADGSSVVPPPPPNTRGRDPVFIALQNFEPGCRLEVISLSDNPAAEFNDKCRNEIFELPITGFNAEGDVAHVALNAEAMKEKGLVAGERLMIRQVDDEGNPGPATHVFLDPQGWANQQIAEPVQGGGTQNVRGRTIDIVHGLIGIEGNPNPGKTDHVLGKSTVDNNAPVLLKDRVSVTTVELPKGTLEKVPGFIQGMSTLIGGANYGYEHIKTTLDTNEAGWRNSYGPAIAGLRALLDDRKQFDALAEYTHLLANTPNDGTIDWNQVQRLNGAAEAPPLGVVKFDKALEPGVTVTVENGRLGDQSKRSLTTSPETRSFAIALPDLKTGDPIVVTFHDNSGGQSNAGEMYAFDFQPSSKDGKGSRNPLSIRFGGGV
ncbi:MAG: hypothetical protein IT383_23870 [Deltaproteobacteria bacterium]|nr:hypothetical protein [Deltaproteobacteria bacterium]